MVKMLSKRSKTVFLGIPLCLVCLFAIGAKGSDQGRARGVAEPTCMSAKPCIEYDNNGSGPGLTGAAVTSNGLVGTTSEISTSPASAAAGVEGADLSTSGRFDSGVRGTSKRGSGVRGFSNTGPGVYGTSPGSNGVVGVTTFFSESPEGATAGVVGQDKSTFATSFNSGVRGTSTFGTGVSGFATSGTGVSGTVTQGNGVVGFSTNGSGAVIENDSSFVFDLYVTADNPNGPLISAFNRVTNGGMIVDTDGSVALTGGLTVGRAALRAAEGSVDISGEYQKNDSSVAGGSAPTAPSGGRAVITYAPTVSQPTVEDFGEAQLSNGQAYVRLDAKFVNVVEQTANYLVFITPEGEANVLYVTQKSTTGFAVRESHGGHSTVAFSYRIVAKPFGSRAARLPMVELPRLRRQVAPAPIRPLHV